MEKKEWVVCIFGGNWFKVNTNTEHNHGPQKDDILKIVNHFTDPKWGLCYSFREWPDQFFEQKSFRLIDYSVGERVCESIERQPVKQLTIKQIC